MNKVDVPGVYTLMTVNIDIRGQKIIAQSIIPGVLQGENASTLVYGSVNNGASIAAAPGAITLIVSPLLSYLVTSSLITYHRLLSCNSLSLLFSNSLFCYNLFSSLLHCSYACVDEAVV